MLLIILLNTLMLSLDKYPDYDSSVENIFSYLNIFFVFFFTMESTLKIVGLGVRPFFYDSFNCFDFIVVISSL
jgi:voltage-gated sodium channel